MKKLAAPVTVALGCSLLLAGCASYDGVDAETFAKVSCTQMSGLYDIEDGSVALMESITEINNDARTQLQDQGTKTLDALATAKDELAKNQPAVKDGEEIVGYFSEYFDSRIAAANTAISTFESASQTDDPTAFSDAAVAYLTDISDSGAHPFPYESIKNQKIVNAVDKEPTCKDIVSVN